MSDCDFDFDLDCLETKQNTRYYLDIKILEAVPPYTQFNSLSSSKINKLKKFPGLQKNIKEYNSTQYTSDQSTLISKNGFDFSLINLSPNNSGISPFIESDIVTVSENSLIALGFFDYHTADKQILKIGDKLLERQSTYYKIKSSSLVTLDPRTLDQTTLMTFTSELNDSLFVEKTIERLKYGVDSKSVFLVLKEESYHLESPNQNPDDWEQGTSQLSLLNLSNGNNLDTLFKFTPVKFDYIRSLQVTNDYVIVNKSDSIYIFDLNGSIENIIRGSFPKSYSGINSFTYNGGKDYFNIEENYSINLSQYVENLTSSNPYDDIILITEGNTLLHIFSIPKKEIIQTISLDDLPPVSQSKDKINSLGLYHPILTSNNLLRLIYIDSYYNDDPDDDCEI